MSDETNLQFAVGDQACFRFVADESDDVLKLIDGKLVTIVEVDPTDTIGCPYAIRCCFGTDNPGSPGSQWWVSPAELEPL